MSPVAACAAKIDALGSAMPSVYSAPVVAKPFTVMLWEAAEAEVCAVAVRIDGCEELAVCDTKTPTGSDNACTAVARCPRSLLIAVNTIDWLCRIASWLCHTARGPLF